MMLCCLFYFLFGVCYEIKHILVQLLEVSDELLKLLSCANEECSIASEVSSACILWWKRQRKLPCSRSREQNVAKPFARYAVMRYEQKGDASTCGGNGSASCRAHAQCHDFTFAHVPTPSFSLKASRSHAQNVAKPFARYAVVNEV